MIASEKMWREPLRWDLAAARAEQRHRVFCASLADVFEDRPELVAPRARLFKVIVATPHLDWLLLTKRPENASKLWAMAHAHARPWSNETPVWARNVWLGVSVEDQQRADERIPLLLKVPAAVRFLLCDPLLGSVDLKHLQPGDPPTEIDALAGTHGVLRPHRGTCGRVDWVICGGESGPGARPMNRNWVCSLRDQCAAERVPFFFRQWGEWMPVSGKADDSGLIGENGESFAFSEVPPEWVDGKPHGKWWQVCEEWFGLFYRAGKASSGRLLDGRLHDGLPALPAEVPHAT